MASSDVLAHPPLFDDDEELSDEQIQQLLKDAEARLARSSESDQRGGVSTQSSGRLIARSRTVTPYASYIQEKDGIATVDPKILISEEQRKLSETLRTVETATVSKKIVSTLNTLLSTLHVRKKYSNISLDADQLSVMDSPAPMRALFS